MDDRKAETVVNAHLRSLGYKPLGRRCFGMPCHLSPDGRTVVVSCVRVTPPDGDVTGPLGSQALQRMLWALATLVEDDDTMTGIDTLRGDDVVVCDGDAALRVAMTEGVVSCRLRTDPGAFRTPSLDALIPRV